MKKNRSLWLVTIDDDDKLSAVGFDNWRFFLAWQAPVGFRRYDRDRPEKPAIAARGVYGTCFRSATLQWFW